ncbi:hypothetical protein [Flavobacterium agrisoli]|uniref:Uncharacterized protein n=1 Tax=Flavobacterium agrisoli TaxID=2793066 RepID=A0A934PKT3_9FLAO|nr:hypothetical protein [Flavobacterium agrisoli]MBK0369115.1 hypothetical protein [Flavobacterium agrisoli]
MNHEYGFSEEGKTNTAVDSGNLIINGDNLEALKSYIASKTSVLLHKSLISFSLRLFISPSDKLRSS